jgi:hypothetical protein
MAHEMASSVQNLIKDLSSHDDAIRLSARQFLVEMGSRKRAMKEKEMRRKAIGE